MTRKAAQSTPNQLLRQARLERGWTQKDVAGRIGAPLDLNVTRWERGTARPSAYYVQRLCKLFGKSPGELGLLPKLQQLQEALTSKQQDLRSVPEPHRLWNVPFRRNPFFTGREEVLHQLHERLTTRHSAAVSQAQALSGLGGIGKTQLAVEYAYRHRQDYQAVLWARAESTEAVISSYFAIAGLLRLPEREAREQELTVQAVKTWLQTHRDWLLILDNADELALLPDFLPLILGGHLLLTTRAAATGQLAQRLEIATLLPEQGAVFLLRRAGLLAPEAELAQASTGQRELALRLSQELGGLPLALDQAGAYMEETGTDLVGYWPLYQQHRAALLRERRGLVADHPEPVATTWLLAFVQVAAKQPAAADLLRLCAFLAPDAIPEEVLTADASQLGPAPASVVADALLLNQAIQALRAYSLVQRDPAEKSLSVHRLVQAVLRDALSETERRAWAERAMRAVNAALPDEQYETWAQCERLLPQALAAAQSIEHYQLTSEEAGRLLYQTAVYLRDRARYTEAEPLYLRVWRIWEQQLGPEHPLVAYPLYDLADLYREQGKYAEAEPLFQRALRIREQALGPEHPDVAAPLHGLANLYSRQGKYTEAEPLFQRALRIREQALGPEHPWVAYPLNDLANLYRAQGKYAEAEPLYQGALHIWEQAYGAEHPHVAFPVNGLASLYREQGRYTEAEPLYQRALRIREQALAPEHPHTAETIHDLAQLWEVQGNREEAMVWYVRALAMRELALGTQHPRTRETRSRLMALLHALGRHEQAAQLEIAQVES
jgi:tetratricopeptide (TPR) repeat protein